MFDASKIVIFGKVSCGEDSELLSCMIVFNLVSKEVEKLKILSFMQPDVSITCVAYGPFDNGHILLGLSDGWLLAYEYPSLDRIDSKHVFMASNIELDSFDSSAENNSADAEEPT